MKKVMVIKMSKWVVTTKKADFQNNGKKYGISPVVARIIRNRDLVEEAEIQKYLRGTLEDLYSPLLLKGMEQGVSIIEEKIHSGKKIRVIGDYDVDGVCSTYILSKGLSVCGANVDAVIPHRRKDGYGLNENLVREAYEDGVDTIITCDNGIAAKRELDYANSLGITTVVTDHHEVPYSQSPSGERIYEMPEVAAVIDPKQPHDCYPYKNICGATVVFKFVEQLLKKSILSGEEKKSIYEELLEFAGFATICDVMELMDENRILVKHALALIRNTKNMGLRALIECNQIAIDKLASYHVGFVLGPCMNATGRLDSALKALELLQCTEQDKAMKLAMELKSLNEERKAMTEQGVIDGKQYIEDMGLHDDRVLVIYLPDCHESLAGIIAGRIRESYYRPTFVLTKGEDSVKGSARSIDQYHVYEEMCKCKELFLKFGGHKLAAGMSLEESNVDIFRKRINELCTLQEADLEEKVVIDMAMPLSYVTEDLIEELEVLEPFGMGNPKPVFAERNLRFVSGRKFGVEKNVGKYQVLDEENRRFELIAFRNTIEALDNYVIEKFGISSWSDLYGGGRNGVGKIRMNIIYYPSINEYQGRTSVQFVLQQFL